MKEGVRSLKKAHVIIACLLVAAIAVPAGAWALVVTTDDDIPGVPITASPVSGTVDYINDMDDVYSVNLVQGQTLYASTAAPSLTDVDLYLWGPNTRSKLGTEPAVALSETAGSSSERFFYTAPATGRYYLDVWAFDDKRATPGDIAYTLTYGFPDDQPAVTAAAPTICAWGASPAVTGIVRDSQGSPIAGAQVNVYARPAGKTTFTKVAAGTADASGAYAVPVKPALTTTYRVRSLGGTKYFDAVSNDVKIMPKAYLSTPATTSRVYRGRTFSATGYLKPRHASGARTVKLTCYRKESGRWKARKTVYATNSNYSSYTKYSARLALPYTGSWKIVASAATDAYNAAGSSAGRYVYVR